MSMAGFRKHLYSDAYSEAESTGAGFVGGAMAGGSLGLILGPVGGVMGCLLGGVLGQILEQRSNIESSDLETSGDETQRDTGGQDSGSRLDKFSWRYNMDYTDRSIPTSKKSTGRKKKLWQTTLPLFKYGDPDALEQNNIINRYSSITRDKKRKIPTAPFYSTNIDISESGDLEFRIIFHSEHTGDIFPVYPPGRSKEDTSEKSAIERLKEISDKGERFNEDDSGYNYGAGSESSQ